MSRFFHHDVTLDKNFFCRDLPSTSAAADALELKSRQLYRNNKEKLVASINENYKKYRSIPESHPLYKKEWEVFWLRRHNELKKEGKIDLDSYDYRPEWIKHFVAKIDEFEKIELQKVDDKRSQERHVTPKRTIETSSSSSDNENCDDRGNAAKKRFKRDYDSISSNRFFIHQNGVKKPELKSRGITDNDEVSVITVCRSLLALESDLGILASKVLLLLSSAVTFERENPNSSDEIILSDSENVVLLQTVQQKLKGMAILNLLEPNKMLIVKKSIQNIAILVHRANGKPQKSEKFSELANEISQALVASGNGNCTSEQLDELTSEFSEHFSVEPKHVASRTSKVTKKSSPIESLSDYEIKILLDNFANLTETEQRQIMDFLKNLETNDPGKADIFKNFLRSGSSGIFQVEQDVGYSFDDCRMSLFY